MRYIITIGLIITAFSLSAQSLRGNLSSKKSEKALGYGNVDIYKEGKLVASVLTDRHGNFNVALDTGSYKCVINYAGHLSIEKDVVIRNDETKNFSMAEDPSKPPVPAEEVVEYTWEAAERVSDKKPRGVKGRVKKDYVESEIAPAYMTDGEMMGELYDGVERPDRNGSPRSGALTAGEINDFSKWKMWQDLTDKELKAYATAWKIAPVGRYTLALKSQMGLPLADAIVRLMANNTVLYTSRTDNTGKAELWLSSKQGDVSREGLSMEIDYLGQKKKLRRVKPFEESVNHYIMDVECYEMNNVDIAFVVDATGSMGDELAYLKEEMNDVIFKSKQISSSLNFRFANVFYRDQGDAYVTKSMDFSRVLSESVQFISAQNAGGGGDYEEAVEEGLEKAIHELKWSEEARARVLFLILDAPPHNTSAIQQKLERLMRQAAEKGIRIVPVGASGINKSTEYLMRTLAIGTNGTYTFLTNHSGIGNAHIEPSTDTYKVETFNDLLVRVLKSYTYMPDCEQNLPDLQLEYPDSLVIVNTSDTLNTPDSLNVSDSLDVQPIDPRPVVQWSYYPNPTTGIINIKSEVDIDELFLTDLSGKLLQSIRNVTKDRVHQMDLTEYTTGIYLLRYLHEDRWISGKIMLQR